MTRRRPRRRQDAPDWIIRGGTSSRSRRPPDWIIQEQVAADARDWNIRSRTRIRWGQNKKEQPKPHDSKGRGKEYGRPGLEHPGTSGGGRPGLEHPGRNKRQEPPPPGQEHQGTSGGSSPRLEHPGLNTQGEPPPPGLESSGESGGQKRRRQEAQAEVSQRCRQDRKQHKGQCHGDAQKQR